MRNPNIQFDTDYIPTLAEARAMSDAQLDALLNRGYASMEHGIRIFCVVYCALKERGDARAATMSKVVQTYAEQVVAEQVLPGLIAAYYGQPTEFLEAVTRLVPEEQSKFLKAVKYPVRGLDSTTGKFVTRNKRLSGCSLKEIAIITNGGRMRSPEEQEKLIRQAMPKNPPAAPSRVAGVEAIPVYAPGNPGAPPPARAPKPLEDTLLTGIDLFSALSVKQRKALTDAITQQARGGKPDAAAFLKDHLIRHKVIPVR